MIPPGTAAIEAKSAPFLNCSANFAFEVET
jgi:hypothetical protein